METAFITAPLVARLLGLPSAASLLARRRQMERIDDFPRPMPHSRRPLLWRASEVRAWIKAQGRPASATPPRPAPALSPGRNPAIMAEALRA
ncbi:MAG: helix-turn-helix transcriptional regulator [Pararhodobacter sp.]